MTLQLLDGELVNANPVNQFSDITPDNRLFFGLIENSKFVGLFKEIKDVSNFIKMEQELQDKNILSNCSELSYIKHHNFHIA